MLCCAIAIVRAALWRIYHCLGFHTQIRVDVPTALKITLCGNAELQYQLNKIAGESRRSDKAPFLLAIFYTVDFALDTDVYQERLARRFTELNSGTPETLNMRASSLRLTSKFT